LHYFLKYKDTTNQTYFVRVIDQHDFNPYKFRCVVVDNGNGTQTITFTFDPLPANTTSLSISYSADNGITWVTLAVSTASPVSITIPVGAYLYKATVYRPTGDEMFIVNGSVSSSDTIELQGTDDAVRLVTVNNEEDKFSVIKSREAVIKFLTTNNTNLSSFLVLPLYSTRYKVTVALNDEANIIFVGFLRTSDNSEPFLSHRNVCTLTASDMLGSIKRDPLVNFNGKNPMNENRIIDYIAWALNGPAGTGLSLPINVISNIREQDDAPASANVTFIAAGSFIDIPYGIYVEAGMKIKIVGSALNDNIHTILNVAPGATQRITSNQAIINEASVVVMIYFETGHWMNTQWIDAKTFEQEIGVSTNPYDALVGINKWMNYVCQRNGEWWIKAIDEYDQQPNYITRFSSQGVWLENLPGKDFNKTVSSAGAIYFSNNKTTVLGAEPLKFAKLVYNYNTWKEIICNIDFLRGALISTISPTEKRYSVECWTLKRGTPIAPGVPTSTQYIRRIFNADSYEMERYIVLTPQVRGVFSSTDYVYSESEPVPMNIKDKFSLSVDWKVANNITGFANFYPLIRAILKGNDGSWWILGNKEFHPSTYNQDDYVWYNTANWTMNTAAGTQPINWTTLTNETEWQSLIWEAPPLPVAGKIYAWLHELNNTNQAGDNIDIHYRNLRLTYKPYISGTYQTFIAQSNKLTQAVKNTGTIDDTVLISNSPTKLFKGTLMKKRNGEFVLSGLFYNSAVFHDAAPPAGFYFKTFGTYQIYAVFNQYRQVVRTFRATLNGLTADALDVLGKADIPDFIHTYRFNYSSPHCTRKQFMLLSADQDMLSNGWQATLKEVFNEITGKQYDDVLEFKLITQ
jgi:hypothetical protein